MSESPADAHPRLSQRQARELQKLHSDGAAGLQRRRTAPLSERLRRLFHSGPAQAQSAGGGRHLEPVCSDPNVYLVHHFLSASELEHLDGLITDRRGAFKQSVTDDAAGGTSSHVVESQERTSASLHLPKGGDTSLRAIEARAAELVGLPSDYVEPLQVVTYTNGQRFDLHHDSGSLHYEEGGEEVITVSAPQGPKRLVTTLACLACTYTASALHLHCTYTAPALPAGDALVYLNTLTLTPTSTPTLTTNPNQVTLFVYLNTLPEGVGHTDFPQIGLSVRPRSGTALLFCNVAANGEPDPRVCHRACPVPPGHHKFGCNVWIADCTMGLACGSSAPSGMAYPTYTLPAPATPYPTRPDPRDPRLTRGTA
jgi:hypothetical protein